MRIGIDLDDTICRTTEMVHEKMDEYAIYDIIMYTL